MEFLFPGGAKKALTFSYDDGQMFDARLIELFHRYSLKGTFHLNSGTLGDEGYIRAQAVPELYRGMEVAGHSVTHAYLDRIPRHLAMREIWEDNRNLELITGRTVRGFSYPFGEFGEEAAECLKRAGLEYSRTVRPTYQFGWPHDFLRWDPTCHHNQVSDELVGHFLNPPDYEKTLFFYIWGHSFEFEREQTWKHFEEICEKLSGHADVWYATNIEIKEYIAAVRNLVLSADSDMLYNPSAQTVVVENRGNIVEAEPGKTIRIP